MSKNRTLSVGTSGYTLALQSGEPGIVLCDTALFTSSVPSPGAGESNTLPANTRHPHSGKGKLFLKSSSGTVTVHIFAS